MEENNITGPIFVSIGDQEKLATFLKQNPDINPTQMFVDDYNFDAYKSVGFQSFLDIDKEVAKKAKMTAPNLSFSQWIGYFLNVMMISPVPKDLKLGEIPEGVLRLGGTFVVDGDQILYQWNDKIPGDHPDIQEVLSAAKGGII